jgi:hypothetical protein
MTELLPIIQVMLFAFSIWIAINFLRLAARFVVAFEEMVLMMNRDHKHQNPNHDS